MSRPRLLFLRFWPQPKAGPARSRVVGHVADGQERAPLVALRPWQPRLPSHPSRADRMLLFGESEDVNEDLPPSFHTFLSQLSPLVESHGHGGAVLDLKGCERLHPDPRKLLRRIEERALRSGLGAISAGEGASRLVARLAAATAPRGMWWKVEEGMAQRFLSPFPLACLGLEQGKWKRIFKELGVETLGELAALPPQLLREALGEESLEVWREARGEGVVTLRTESSVGRLSESYAFSTVQGDRAWVRSVLGVLADRLAVRLRQGKWEAGRLELRVNYHGEGLGQSSCRLHPPTNTLTVLRDRAWELWTSTARGRTGVLRCTLEVKELRPWTSQALRFDFARAKEDLAPFIARVRQRFGDGAVQWSPELWMESSKKP